MGCEQEGVDKWLLETDCLGFTPILPFMSYVTLAPCLGFLTCKMGVVIIVASPWGCVEDYMPV